MARLLTWRDEYNRKLVRPAEAVKAVQSGQRVLLGSCCSEPETLIEALVADKTVSRAWSLSRLSLDRAQYSQPMEATSMVSFRPDMSVRDATGPDIDYLPCLLSEAPRLFTGGHLPIDVSHGQLSPLTTRATAFGVSVDYEAGRGARIW